MNQCDVFVDAAERLLVNLQVSLCLEQLFQKLLLVILE
jgi:hypothetical protein